MRTTLHEILPESTANTFSPKSSRLAHPYGLPKTHKATLSMRSILSATGTYNYKLAKWLEEKLKPLSINEYTINDAFIFFISLFTLQHATYKKKKIYIYSTLLHLHYLQRYTVHYPKTLQKLHYLLLCVCFPFFSLISLRVKSQLH